MMLGAKAPNDDACGLLHAAHSRATYEKTEMGVFLLPLASINKIIAF